MIIAVVVDLVCAVDLRPSSAGALQWAAGFAEACHARLTLLHVTTNSPAARRALDALQKDVGSNAAVRIESGEPAEVVAPVTQELNADVLVIGRASPSEFLGRLGMTEYSIIRESPVPSDQRLNANTISRKDAKFAKSGNAAAGNGEAFDLPE